MAILKSIIWKAESTKPDATRQGSVSGIIIFLIEYDASVEKWYLNIYLPITRLESANFFTELGGAQDAADKVLLYFWSKITDMGD